MFTPSQPSATNPPSESTSTAATSARSGGGRTPSPRGKPVGSCPVGTAGREAPLECAATCSCGWRRPPQQAHAPLDVFRYVDDTRRLYHRSMRVLVVED